MIQHQASHVDHGLTEGQLRYLLDRFADRDGFFIETFTLPRDLGTVPCGLYGPIVGDSAIAEDEVTYARRGDRAWTSRLVDLPTRQQHEVTVIAGPHEEACPTCRGTGETFHIDLGFGPFNQTLTCYKCRGTKKITHTCVLYTAFGGPCAPQEPGDLRRQLEALETERRERRQRGEEPVVETTDPAEVAKADPLYAKILGLRRKRDESDAFWRDHALAR